MKLHLDDKEKSNSLKNFMSIFANIQDTSNFRDIVEPHMELIFKYLVKYSKECFDFCFQNFLLYPFYNSNQPNYLWRNFTEILMKFLLNKLENTNTENLDPWHPYYHMKDDFHLQLQKLIKIPIKCLNKYVDDSFIKPYFKQFIATLIKKTRNLIKKN